MARVRMPSPGGKVGHAELIVGDSMIMLADEHPEMGARAPHAYGGSAVSLMRRPDGDHRGSLWAPLVRRHSCRGGTARRDGEARSRRDAEVRRGHESGDYGLPPENTGVLRHRARGPGQMTEADPWPLMLPQC